MTSDWIRRRSRRHTVTWNGLLHRMLGPGAEFRHQQREAIEAVLRDGARVLLVERTGWGKSAVYWIATRCWRDQGHGPTLIISPLLSLMRDQLRAATRLGLRAVTVNSMNRDEWKRILGALEADDVDVLLGLSRAARERRVPCASTFRPSRSRWGCSSSTRCTASRTGATTSGRTTVASRAILRIAARRPCQCWVRLPPPTLVSRTTWLSSSAAPPSRSSVRLLEAHSACRHWHWKTRRSDSRGWPRTCPIFPVPASSTA